MVMADLHADPSAIGVFVRSMFRYADTGTFISLRAFDQFSRDVPPRFIRPVVFDDLETLIHHASKGADDCAQYARPAVFAPPICTFSNPESARGIDLANGLVLSVELDDVDPDAALARLAGLIGPPTMVVHSGSEWTEAGISKPKTHIHWRLSEPTRDQEEHDKLRQARTLAALLVGADPTGKPVVHPLRWPGSWNCKGEPRIASIAVHNETAEIDLGEALDALEAGVDAAGWGKTETPHSSTPEAPLALIRDAMSRIPNQGAAVHYDEWIRLGYAVWRATGGAGEGYDIWDTWSSLSDKYDGAETELAWQRVGRALAGKAPPRTIGAGTIFYLAEKAGWKRPERFSSLFGERRGEYAETADEAGQRKKGRPEILHLEDVECLPPPEFLIDGLFPAGGLIVVYGPPKSGKTFLVLSACLHLAANRDWFGHRSRGGCVVYIAGEGVGGLGTRLKAMRSHYQIPSNIPFYVIPRAINFTDPGAAAYLVKLVRDTVGDEPIAAVIVDTLARSMAGADENSAKEVGVVIAACDQVRDELACAVIPIHHQGKDETRGLRGTSAIRGAVDAAFRVTASGKRLTLRNEDQKDAECAPEMVFEMVEVPVGISRKSLVPVLQERDDEAPAREEKPRGITGFALEILTDTIAGPESAMLPPLEGLPGNTRGVAIDVFRREFYERNATRAYEARKKAFGRAVDALVERRLVAMRDPWIWLVN